jgi:hypothetical protein
MPRAHAFVVVHEVTSNSAIGEPQPPFGEEFHWHAVHLGRDQTMWRRIGLHADGRSERAKRLLQEIGSARWRSEGRRILEQFVSQASPEEIEEVLAEVLDLINEFDEDDLPS